VKIKALASETICTFSSQWLSKAFKFVQKLGIEPTFCGALEDTSTHHAARPNPLPIPCPQEFPSSSVENTRGINFLRSCSPAFACPLCTMIRRVLRLAYTSLLSRSLIVSCGAYKKDRFFRFCKGSCSCFCKWDYCYEMNPFPRMRWKTWTQCSVGYADFVT